MWSTVIGENEPGNTRIAGFAGGGVGGTIIFFYCSAHFYSLFLLCVNVRSSIVLYAISSAGWWL